MGHKWGRANQNGLRRQQKQFLHHDKLKREIGKHTLLRKVLTECYLIVGNNQFFLNLFINSSAESQTYTCILKVLYRCIMYVHMYICSLYLFLYLNVWLVRYFTRQKCLSSYHNICWSIAGLKTDFREFVIKTQQIRSIND